MKFVKTLNHPNGVKCFEENYAIYELDEKEQALCDGHKYLVTPKIPESILERENSIIRRIPQAISESFYAYGVGFCDTIKECELFFIASSLQVKLNKVSEILGNNSSICGQLGAADLGCAIKKGV